MDFPKDIFNYLFLIVTCCSYLTMIILSKLALKNIGQLRLISREQRKHMRTQ